MTLTTVLIDGAKRGEKRKMLGDSEGLMELAGMLGEKKGVLRMMKMGLVKDKGTIQKNVV